MADWQNGDVIANGINIHYYRTGSGSDKPPLVLAHGATDNGRCWIRLTRALEAEYDVIMPDARGHGLSDAPEGEYSAAAHAADLAGLIDALKLEKPAVGGHSMGAGSTLCLVAEYPHIARCAILEDPGFRGAAPSEADQEARRARMRQNAAQMKALGRDGIIARGRAQHPDWAEEEFGPWADSKLQVSDRFSTAPRRMGGSDWREQLPKVKCPVLLITADPDRGSIVTPEMAEEAKRLLPTLKVVHIAGAGHNVRREQFDAYLKAVRAFLAEV